MKGILTNICKTIKLIDLDDGLGQIEKQKYIFKILIILLIIVVHYLVNRIIYYII